MSPFKHVWPLSYGAFSPPSISAWVDRPAPYPRCHSKSLEPSFRDQPLVGQPSIRNSIHEAVNALGSVPLDVAVIQAECEFVDVPACVLRADVVEGSMHSTLHNGVSALLRLC